MNPLPIEPPYTVADVAAMLGFSRQTVTRMFQKERGVLFINRPTTNRKRRYCSIRIPRHVFNRVLREMSR